MAKARAKGGKKSSASQGSSNVAKSKKKSSAKKSSGKKKAGGKKKGASRRGGNNMFRRAFVADPVELGAMAAGGLGGFIGVYKGVEQIPAEYLLNKDGTPSVWKKAGAKAGATLLGFVLGRVVAKMARSRIIGSVANGLLVGGTVNTLYDVVVRQWPQVAPGGVKGDEDQVLADLADLAVLAEGSGIDLPAMSGNMAFAPQMAGLHGNIPVAA